MTVQLLTVQVRIKSLDVEEELVLKCSLPTSPKVWQYQVWLTINPSLPIVWIGSPTHFSSPVNIRFRNGLILVRFSSDSLIEIRFMKFFALIWVPLIHWASFITQSYLDGSQQFSLQSLASDQWEQYLHDGWIRRFALFYHYWFLTIGLPERGSSVT